MRKVKQINFKVSRLIYSTVLENIFLTVALTAIISATITLNYKDIIRIISKIYFSLFILIFLILYYCFAYENFIKKVNGCWLAVNHKERVEGSN